LKNRCDGPAMRGFASGRKRARIVAATILVRVI
jgi:hypothetical protein